MDLYLGTLCRAGSASDCLIRSLNIGDHGSTVVRGDLPIEIFERLFDSRDLGVEGSSTSTPC